MDHQQAKSLKILAGVLASYYTYSWCQYQILRQPETAGQAGQYTK